MLKGTKEYIKDYIKYFIPNPQKSNHNNRFDDDDYEFDHPHLTFSSTPYIKHKNSKNQIPKINDLLLLDHDELDLPEPSDPIPIPKNLVTNKQK